MYGPSWSGGRCPFPGPVSSRPARGGGRWGGCPPTPCADRRSAAGPLGRVSAACCPPGSGPAANPGREAADELDVPSAARLGSPRSAVCRSRSAGVGMVGMCLRLVRGLLDRRWRSVADDVSWALICRDLHGPCPNPHGRRLAVLREAACGCGAGSGHSSLSPGAAPVCRLGPLRCEDCLGPSAGRTVGGGFFECQRGKPPRVVAPCGVLGSYGVAPACRAPGPLGTVVAGGLRTVPGTLGTQGWPRCSAFAWLHRCAGLVPLPV